MNTAYFLGAGASAEDGLPVTRELNYAIANFLCSPRGKDSSLLHYYRELYGLTLRKLEPAANHWRTFIGDREKRPAGDCPLPDIIETLSMLDLALQEGASLGASRLSHPTIRELDQPTLVTARLELSMALGLAIKDAMHNHRTPRAHDLVRNFSPGDVVVSANWDTLVERALTAIQRRARPGRRLVETNIRYCAIGERLVRYGGLDIKTRAKDLYTVLKLHGSLNWFHCPSCGELYANVEGVWVIDPLDPRDGYDQCHCLSWLENLLIAPSFVKAYRNVHIRSSWQHAQRALERADRWVFIGYRLPTDDYHIRSLLMRSLRSNYSRRERYPRIVVVGRKTSDEMQKNYRELFRLVDPDFIDGGLEGWLGHAESQRG